MSGEEEMRADLDRAQEALRRVGKAAITVKTSLTKPYKDAPETNPWEQFLYQPAKDAYNLGIELRRKYPITPPLADVGDDFECCASGRCEVCSPGFVWGRDG